MCIYRYGKTERQETSTDLKQRKTTRLLCIDPYEEKKLQK